MNVFLSRVWRAGVLLVAVSAGDVHAQIPSAVDTIVGRITARDSVPIPGADIRIGGENGAERAGVSDSSGRYVFVLPSRPTYFIAVRAFGFVPFSIILERPPESNRIQRDIRLNALPIALPRVKVVARNPGEQRPSPGDRAETWGSDISSDLPVEQGDFLDIAAMQAGVARLGADGSDLSINGQPGDQNRSTVDGSTFSGASLPAEGVRSIGVVLNTYDVSRGQFSGGQIVATTISGTNKWGGALGLKADDPRFRYGASHATPFRNERRIGITGGGGGAVIRNKLFIYGALDLLAGRSQPEAAILDPAAIREMGFSMDSVYRFHEILKSLSMFPARNGNLAATSDFASLLGRVDYAFSQTHSLTARIDGRTSKLSDLGGSSLALKPGRPTNRTGDAGLLAQMTSISGSWANELRLYRATGRLRAGSQSQLPEGMLSGAALLNDQSGSDYYIGFGGPTPETSRDRALTEFSEDLVHESPEGKHRFKTGIIFQKRRSSITSQGNSLGTFVFNSLEDLERGQATLFTRDLMPRTGSADRNYTAMYFGDVWHLKPVLSFTYGLRLDRNQYGDRQRLPDAAASIISGASTNIPNDLILVPRAGFRYDRKGRHSLGIEGGFGGFAGATNIESLASVWNQTGRIPGTLICAGDAAPTAEWRDYSMQPSAIPSSCANASPLLVNNAPTITVFSPQFATPRTWKATLRAGGRLTPQWGLGIDALLIHGTHVATSVDRNLVLEERFNLPSENSRPVFALPAGIDSVTGSAALTASRINPSLGMVREIAAAGKSWTQQVTTSIVGSTPKTGLISLAYTYSRSRVFGSGGLGPTALGSSNESDPRQFEWQDASFTPVHAFRVLSSKRITQAFRISTIGRFSSGLPFTPLVRGDVNGDGVNNDRAFVFGPGSTTDPAIIGDMARLRESSSKSIRNCLDRQSAQIAGLGSCRSNWTPSLDMRAEFRTLGDIKSRLITISLTAANVASGLDYLLHGQAKLRNWGQYAYPDPTLLQIHGFNSVAQRFNYRVNTNFGKPVLAGLARAPFRLILEGRITVGADPRSQPMMERVNAMLGSSFEKIHARTAEQVRNVPGIILQLAAADPTQLNLTLAQRARLQAAADSLVPKITSIVDQLSESLGAKGPMTALRQATIQDGTETARKLLTSGVESSRLILNTDQWAKIPGWVTRPLDADRLASLEFEMWIPAVSK